MKKKTSKPKRNKQSKKGKDNNVKKVNKALRKNVSENKNDLGANYENAFWSPY